VGDESLSIEQEEIGRHVLEVGLMLAGWKLL
jgi:hypothetical protein